MTREQLIDNLVRNARALLNAVTGPYPGYGTVAKPYLDGLTEALDALPHDGGEKDCNCGIADMSPKEWFGVPQDEGGLRHSETCPAYLATQRASTDNKKEKAMTTPTQLIGDDSESIRQSLGHIEDVAGDLNDRYSNACAAGRDLAAAVTEALKYDLGDQGGSLHDALNAFDGRESANFDV